MDAFRYQLLLSLAAWLELRDDERLFLEVSEDFSVQSENLATDVQVKSSRATSGPRRYSLQSAHVRAVLSRFWERATEDSSIERRLIFIAKGGASRERHHAFPDGIPGLVYWQRAARDGDTEPIRAALSVLFRGEALGKWIAEDPSDADLRERLLRQVRWALEAQSTDVLNEQLRDQVGDLLLSKGLFAIAADDAIRALLGRVFETACKASPEDRQLTRMGLHRAIEEIIAPTALAQMMGRQAVAPDVAGASQSVLVNEVGSLPVTFTQRVATVKEVLDATRGEPITWLHGAHGVGKSTLAKLLAREIGGRWIALDLRPVQTDPSGCLTAWREFVRVLISGAPAHGVIIDDLAASARDALRPRIAALAEMFAGRGARIILTSPSAPSPASLLELGSSSGAAVLSPYFSVEEVLDLVSGSGAPEENTQQAWAAIIHLGTSGGHPLLTAAKVASLRARNWPATALAEDFGPKTSEAVRTTRDEARQQLLRELSSLDSARSIDAGKVLRRIACVYDRVDDALAKKLAAADPPIANAGDALAVLRGTWLELLPKGDFRLSPLLGDIASDVLPDDALRWRRIAAEHWLGTRVLDERTLPLCFWNAFWGKHTWVLFKLCEVLQTLPRERLIGAAALLAPMTVLVTDRSFYPDNPTLAAELRLLQFEVADATEQGKLAGEIASRLLVEIDDVPIEDLKPLLMSVSASKVLMARFAQTTPEDQLEYALRLRHAIPRTIEISGGRLPDPSDGILGEFGGHLDVAGLLFARTIERVRGSEDLFALVGALDKLSRDDRNSFLDAADTVYQGLSVLAQSGSSHDQLANREMKNAQHCYEEIKAIATDWDRSDLMVELACASSVIFDEGLDDADGAIRVIDLALAKYDQQAALVRQKAKVLGHAGRDAESARLLMTVEDEVGGSSPFDRALALRDGGVSAARAQLFEDAIRLFAKAADAIAANKELRALRVGLICEQALALWEDGNRTTALSTLGDAFDLLETVSATTTRQGELAHHAARYIGGLFWHDSESYPRNQRPPVEFGIASTLSGSDEELLDIDLKPLADNWRILALVEILAGVDAGIEQRSQEKQTGPGLISIESLIFRARYGRSLTSGIPDSAIQDGIAATSAFKVALEKTQSLQDERAFPAELASTPVEVLLGDPNWREAILRIPLDVLIWGRFQRNPDAGLLDRLDVACRQAFGSEDVAKGLFKAASGRYAVGPASPLPLTTAAALALSEEDVASNPKIRFRRDLFLVGHLAQSLGGSVLGPMVLPKIAAGWALVLKDQRFALHAPSKNCPDIEAAVTSVDTSGLRGAARLILAAAPAVGYDLSGSWEELLLKVAGKDTA